jgi:hypothetical protein
MNGNEKQIGKKSYLGYQPKELNIQKLAMYVSREDAKEIYGYKPKETKLPKKGNQKRF